MTTAPFLGYTSTDTREGMSWALEGYLNDFGIARMGKALYEKTKKPRYKEESAYFLSRAQNYVKLFDRRVGFFQGKDAKGDWRLPPGTFDPRVWGHDYTETNAWTFAFTAPQDTRGWRTSTAAAPPWARNWMRTSPRRRPRPRNSPAPTARSSMK